MHALVVPGVVPPAQDERLELGGVERGSRLGVGVLVRELALEPGTLRCGHRPRAVAGGVGPFAGAVTRSQSAKKFIDIVKKTYS